MDNDDIRREILFIKKMAEQILDHIDNFDRKKRNISDFLRDKEALAYSIKWIREVATELERRLKY